VGVLMRNWECSFAHSSPINLRLRFNLDDVLGSKLLGMKDGRDGNDLGLIVPSIS